MRMNVGKLTHKITINYNAQPDRTDTDGNPWPDWQLLVTAMAKKTTLKGFLYFQAAAVQAEDDVLYTIHYREDIRADMQILDGWETFEIKFPPFDTDGSRQWIDIHARAVLTNGG